MKSTYKYECPAPEAGRKDRFMTPGTYGDKEKLIQQLSDWSLMAKKTHEWTNWVVDVLLTEADEYNEH